MPLLLVFVLMLLLHPLRAQGTEMKTYSQNTDADAGTLITRRAVENGLPGRDGRDGTEGTEDKNGDPGEVGVPRMQRSAETRGPTGPDRERGGPGEPGAPGTAGEADITALRRQVEALQGQVQRLQGALSQSKKVELFPNGRVVGEKIFKTGGFERSFQDAQQICTQAGGQLPSPRSAAENEALRQLAAAEYKSAVFLSMTDIKSESRFAYPTGQPLVYSNWALGEPNNGGSSGREEDCVEILRDGKWNDSCCDNKRVVICEF